MKNKKSKKILLILIIIAIFIIGIFLGKTIFKNQENIKQNSETTTQIVEKQVSTQTIENTLTSSGEIAASSTDKLSLSTSKYFKTMCVEQDDIVSKGENRSK